MLLCEKLLYKTNAFARCASSHIIDCCAPDSSTNRKALENNTDICANALCASICVNNPLLFFEQTFRNDMHFELSKQLIADEDFRAKVHPKELVILNNDIL